MPTKKASANKVLVFLAGGLNALNGIAAFLLKMTELWEKYKERRRQKSKNKRSTKRTSLKNP